MEGNDEEHLSNISSEDEIDNIINYELINNGYTCDKCNSIPEILNIDYINNTLLIKCSNHKSEISMNNFINDTLKHNFYFSVCNICNKNIQKENSNIFKYCYECNKIICGECALIHEKSHNLINNNDYNNKCKDHFNQKYTSFCFNCNRNICNECKKTRIHKEHKKNDFIEIEPTKDDIEQINNFCLKFKNNLDSLNISGKKEIEELIENKNNILKIIRNKSENQLKEYKKYAEDNLNKNIEIFERKKKDLWAKYTEDLNALTREFNSIKLKNKEELKRSVNIINNSYMENKNLIESNYNSLIIKCQKYNRELKMKYNNIIKLNEIILNTYNKNKNQYYYINNVVNNVNFIKKYNKETSNIFYKNINNKYDINIREENIQIKDKIISKEGLKNIISEINKEKLFNINIISSKITNDLNEINFLGNFNFSQLKAISIINCNIKNIDNLKNINCPQLLKLDLSNNSIENIDILKSCNINNLKYLSLKNNKIYNINVFDGDVFSNLEELDLSYNKIEDIKIFNQAKFIRIKVLNLSFNLIKNSKDFKRDNLKYLNKYNIDNQYDNVEENS